MVFSAAAVQTMPHILNDTHQMLSFPHVIRSDISGNGTNLSDLGQVTQYQTYLRAVVSEEGGKEGEQVFSNEQLQVSLYMVPNMLIHVMSAGGNLGLTYLFYLYAICGMGCSHKQDRPTPASEVNTCKAQFIQ